MRIAFAGTPEPAVTVLQHLLATDHDVAFVVTRPDAPTGRGRTMTPSPVAVLAQQNGLECLTPAGIADVGPRFSDVDCVVVVAYGGLVPADLLDIPRHGWINVHFSLLPQWRGASPVQYAIWHGDDVTGATVFRLDQGLDTGPVLGTAATTIGEHDTATTLLARLADLGAQLVSRVVDGLAAGALTAVAQDHGAATYAGKIAVQDARIRWDEPAVAVDRRIRAMTRAPGAWTMAADVRLKVGPVALRPDMVDVSPGHVTVREGAVLVGTATHAVQLGDVLRPGKNWAPADVRLDGTVLT